MAAMMRRQDTIQSVDSFASHDDDFAEYGDETMGESPTNIMIAQVCCDVWKHHEKIMLQFVIFFFEKCVWIYFSFQS